MSCAFSPCPVLVVRNGKSEVSFKKIVVPIDFSACSMKGLDYANALAKKFDASIILLHSLHLQYYVSSDEYARYDFPLLMQQAEKAAREQMSELVQKTDWAGVKVQPSSQIGHASDQICAQATEKNVDLIVTSTHGTTGLKHILVGSIAEVTSFPARAVFGSCCAKRQPPVQDGIERRLRCGSPLALRNFCKGKAKERGACFSSRF